MNKRFFSLLLVLALLVGIIPAMPISATAEVPAPTGAIKQGMTYKIVSPSRITSTFGAYAGGTTAGKLLDGGDGYCVTDGWYLRSGYSTKTSNDGLIALLMTLDQETTIGAIEIVGHSSTGNDMTDFDVQAMVDGEWVGVLSVSSNPFESGKRTKMYTFTPVTATQVRILVNKCEALECKLGEVSLFETSTGNLSRKIDLTGRVVASEQDPKNPVSFAVDGDKSTFLQNFHYPSTLTIDLKDENDQPTAVDHIALYLARGNNCYPTDFTLYIRKTLNGDFEEIGHYSTNWSNKNGLDSIYDAFEQTYMAYEMKVVMTSGVGGAAYIPEIELYQYDRGLDSPGAAQPPTQSPTQVPTQAPTQGKVVTGIRDGLTYQLVNGEITITDCDENKEGYVDIPNWIGTYRVTKIGDFAFADCKKITGIYVPDNVTSIGAAAFINCTYLKTAELPDGVTVIKDSTFHNCQRLTDIPYFTAVTTIEANAFSNCASLTNITLPDSVTTIGTAAFAGCYNLRRVNLPNAVTTIGAKAFENCDRLSNVGIGNCVKSIGSQAFANCYALTEMQLPSSMKELGASAFENCTSLKKATVGGTISTIGEKTFYGCTNLQNIYVGKHVVSVGKNAFADCSALAEVRYGGTEGQWRLISRGSGTVALFNAQIYYGVAEESASQVTNYIGKYGDLTYKIVGDHVVISDCLTSTSGAVKIPETIDGLPVTIIGEKAFYLCGSITRITMPDTVTTIENMGFYGCDNLTSIVFSNNLTSIGEEAFYACEKLSTVKLPNSVIRIGRSAFGLCPKLSAVSLGNSIKTIGNYVFCDSGNQLTIDIPKSVTSIGDGVFYDCDLKVINYAGSYVQWKRISIGSKNEKINSAYIYYASTETDCVGNHMWNTSAVTKPATCKEAGVKTFTCSACKGTKTEPITKLTTHTYDHACDTSCNVCSATRKTSHSYKTTTTKATLSKNGSIVKKCTVCGHTASSTTIRYVKTITLSTTTYTYDGKTKTPSVTVKDSAGNVLTKDTDYTVSYASGRKAVGTYNVVITLKGNYSGSKTLTFTIKPAPEKVTSQPKTQKVEVGEKIKFTVGATGDGLKYQWQSSSNGKTWKNCSSSSAKKATFSFTSKTSHSGNYYRCKITDSSGNVVYTSAVRAYVLGVTTQPKTQKVESGDKIKLTVKATGDGLKYQWQSSSNGKTWKNCSSSSAKKATFSFTSKTSHNGNYYRCKVTDSAGNVVYTSTVRAYVLGIKDQPDSKTVAKGKTAKFTVEATGASVKYQWQVSTNGGKTWKNCTSSSAKKATFSFTTKTSHSGNYYRCKITDSAKNSMYTSKVKLKVK